MIRVALLILLWAALPLCAQDFPALYSVTGVAADDVLNVRIDPEPGAEIVGKLPPDATEIEVLQIMNGWALVNAGEFRNGWALLNADESSDQGFVDARFLTRQEGPPWYKLQSPLTCFGTEPFWNLEIDPALKETRFLGPEVIGTDSEPTAVPIDGVWTGETWNPVAAVATADGMAVMRPEQCSDGMSERTFGISIDLFLHDPAKTLVHGCCSVHR